jgi:hypothetical protein
MSEKETYTLFLNSTDKISGTNNNGQYLVNWDDFLPRGYNFFKMLFSFQTAGGYYKDFSGASTTSNTGTSSTTYASTITSNTSGAITASTNVTLSAANANIYVGMTVSNANISGSCLVAAINGTTLTLSTPQTIPTAQTLTFSFINSTNVLLSGANTNIQIGTPVINSSITGSCFVTAINGALLTLSSPQTIPAGQSLIFNYTNSNRVCLSATNTNIVAGMVVTSASIISPCFVSSVTNSSLITLSSIQSIPQGQTLTFTPVNVFASAKIVFNTGGKSHSFDTKTSSQSNTIGYLQRDVQISTSSSNTLSCFHNQNSAKTISRPNQNVVTVSIYNTCPTTGTNSLLFDTNAGGTALTSDMSNWNMIVEFIPIDDSIQPKHVNF